MWMQKVKVFTNGGDMQAKRVSNGFGYALFASMDASYQKFLVSEVQLGNISFGPVDNEEVLMYQEQKELVEHILYLFQRLLNRCSLSLHLIM